MKVEIDLTAEPFPPCPKCKSNGQVIEVFGGKLWCQKCDYEWVYRRIV